MNIKEQHVALDVDYHGLRYSGVTTLHLVDASREIRVNSVGLKIVSAKVNGTEVPWKDYPEEEAVGFPGGGDGSTELILRFEGTVPTTALKGIYRSHYGDGYILTTQFEATDARRFIPCLDHPAQKATFHFRVRVPSDLEVVFNTPVQETIRDGDHKTVIFQPTPRMSSYLLYLGVGHFEERARNSGNTAVIVAAPPRRGDEGNYALEHAGPILKLFEEYFGIPYPLPKLHLVAVPEYEPGAMENWGAITFREMLILIGSDSSTASRKDCVAVLAHEIAHQWFGNLVTMKWWNDLWLNESFATFMGYKIADRMHPEWHLWEEFFVQRTSIPLLWDSLRGTHPIDVKVERPSQITEVFDEISYGKGANVLRMIEGYIGEEGFRKGVSLYLQKFLYSNAEGGDLWRAMDESTQEPVSRVMEEWVRRPGYPVISVEQGGEGILRLSQSRFALDEPTDETPRPVPITFREGTAQRKILLTGPSLEVPLEGRDALVLLNPGRTGFYRVRYDAELYARLLAAYPTLDPLDRWGILQDLNAFTLEGSVDIPTYLQFLERAATDPSNLVCQEVLTQHNILLDPVLYQFPAYRKAITSFMEGQLQRIHPEAIPGEPDMNKVLRERLLGGLVRRSPATAQRLSAMYPSYDRLDPDLRLPVLQAYIRTGGATAYDEVHRRLQQPSNDEERTRLVRALASAPDPTLCRRTLGMVVGGEIDPTLGFQAISTITFIPEVTGAYWDWFRESFLPLMRIYQGTLLLAGMIQYSLPYFSLRDPAGLQSFLRDHDLSAVKGSMGKGLALGTVLRRFAESIPSP